MLIGKKIQNGSFPKGTKEAAQMYLWKYMAGGQVELQNCLSQRRGIYFHGS